MLFITGHDFGGWWIGSHLDIHTSRRLCADMEQLVGVIGPTALQVGASLAAAICWGIQNPSSGAHFPETLPTDFILELAKPWLGTWVSVRHNWMPTASTELLSEVKITQNFAHEEETESDSDSGESSESQSELRPNNKADRSRSKSVSSDSSSRSQSRSVSRSPSPQSHRDGNLWQFSNFLVSPTTTLFTH